MYDVFISAGLSRKNGPSTENFPNSTGFSPKLPFQWTNASVKFRPETQNYDVGNAGRIRYPDT